MFSVEPALSSVGTTIPNGRRHSVRDLGSALAWLILLPLAIMAGPLAASAQQTLFTTETPVLTGQYDGVPYELGMKFQSSASGQIAAIRYWKDALDAGPHVGRIWSSTGILLATATFAGETASGWQQQSLDGGPLAILANTTYVVSVNSAYYVDTIGGLFFPVVNGALISIADDQNGVFGSPGTFPTLSFQYSNYFRDIVFVSDVPNPPQPAGCLAKLVSVDGGNTFSAYPNRNNPAPAQANPPFDPVQFKLVVTNCGNLTVTPGTVDDCVNADPTAAPFACALGGPGLVLYEPPVAAPTSDPLTPGESVTYSTTELPNLSITAAQLADLCATAKWLGYSVVRNDAEVDGQDAHGNRVGYEAAAYVQCPPPPTSPSPTPTNTPIPPTPTPTNTPVVPTPTNTPCPHVTIGDVIWLDSNGNGLQDANEGGINGVKVDIYTCTQNNVPGSFLGQVTTQTVGGRNGVYTFTGEACTPPAQWLIAVDASNFQPGGALQGLSETTAFVGGNPNSNQDSNCTNGTSDCRAIGANQSDLTVDCGYVPPPPTPTATNTPPPTSTPTPTCTVVSSSNSGFNGTSISTSNYIWFNSNFKASGVPSTGATVFFTNSTVNIVSAAGTFTYPVPDGVITFSPSATCATTVYDTVVQRWVTTVPLSGSDEILLSALGIKAPANVKAATVTWTGTFSSDAPGLSLSWKWGAAVYTTDMTEPQYNNLGVKPAHTDTCAYQNSDHAGTPENVKKSVIGGARGGGGSNYTGSWSGTKSVSLVCQ